jgi:hypothetical protein
MFLFLGLSKTRELMYHTPSLLFGFGSFFILSFVRRFVDCCQLRTMKYQGDGTISQPHLGCSKAIQHHAFERWRRPGCILPLIYLCPLASLSVSYTSWGLNDS